MSKTGKTRTKWDIDKVREVYRSSGCTLLSDTYHGMLEKYTFICKCGREHTSRFESFYKHSRRRKECAKEDQSRRRRKPDKEVIDKIAEKGFTYIRHYRKELSGRTYLVVDYKCKNGHINTGKYYHGVMKGEYSCMDCIKNQLGDSRRLTLQEVRNYLSERGMELLSGDYINNVSPLDVRCVCGEGYTTTLSSIKNDNYCGCRRKGTYHHKYDPNITEEERQDRRPYPEYYQWVKDVYERDNYTCQKCGVRGGSLEAHHILSYASYPEKRTDLGNGVTLCKTHHKEFHKLYGRTEFTSDDFYKFINLL